MSLRDYKITVENGQTIVEYHSKMSDKEYAKRYPKQEKVPGLQIDIQLP